jgi:sialic acid synthase SpsE
MSQFIIEMGSANEHHNDIGYLRDMIDAVIDCDSGKHEVIFKHQLFISAPPNEPLDWSTFGWAYGYAWNKGYQTTASVFDVMSAHFLARFGVPFVKIACRPELYGLMKDPYFLKGWAKAPPFIVSVSGKQLSEPPRGTRLLACIPDYPAFIEDYEDAFDSKPNLCDGFVPLCGGISDHTSGWELYRQVNPTRIEKHFCLKRSPDNPDSGPFAVTPDELREVL